MHILFVIGIAQALFFCFLLLTTKRNKLANVVLSIWLILISCSLLLNYFYVTGNIVQYPHLIGLDTTFPFLYMPILYVYACLLMEKKDRLIKTDGIHLVPFFVYLIYVFWHFYIRSADYKLDFLANLSNGILPIDVQVFNILKIVQSVVYFVLIYNLFRENNLKCLLSRSYGQSNFTWLYIISLCLALIYLLKLFAIIDILFGIGSFLASADQIADLTIVLLVYIVAFIGIKKPNVMIGSIDNDIDEATISSIDQGRKNNTERDNYEKYKSSDLSREESQELLITLQKYMSEKKPYMQNKLTIKDVAEAININSKKLSQVINEQLDQNFLTFINGYRVDEIKKRIISEEYSNLSLLGIALECGFNSKSSFNSVFKKHTGMTPSSYKASHT